MDQNESKLSPFGVILARPGGKKAIKTNGFFNIFVFPIFGLPDLFWTPLGPLLALSWVPSGPLGPPWAPQGVPWEPMGSPGGPPNPSWIHLGAILGPLFASSSPYGASMAHFGAPRRHFGHILDPIWCISAAICMRLGLVLHAKHRIPMLEQNWLHFIS